jgi:pyruvate kinase
MVNTIQSIEEIYPFDKFLEFAPNDPMDVINESAVRLGDALHATGIIAMTTSGQSVKKLARYRPEMTIYAAAHNERITRILTIVWGVVPAYLTTKGNLDDMMREIIGNGLERGIIDRKQTYIFTAGDPVGVQGTTNLIRILRDHELAYFANKKERA